MGAETKIAWCHHTWSPWHGCSKVSAGCANCYAAANAKRFPDTLGVWGPDGVRVPSRSWDKPLAYERAGAAAGYRPRVFPSVCDWLEDWPAVAGVRAAFLSLIHRTPGLDWLLLTKRPENWGRLLREVVRLDSGGMGGMLASRWLAGYAPENVWVGVSVEDQENADERLPLLAEIPAALRWVSYEPALGPVDFAPYLRPSYHADSVRDGVGAEITALDWIVVGGESRQGNKAARPFEVAWAASVVDQCRAAGVAPFVKQLGSSAFLDMRTQRGRWPDGARFDRISPTRSRVRTKHPKGEDPAEWPVQLRVQDFPASPALQPAARPGP